VASWNYLQVEIDGLTLHPVVGPGGMTREKAHGVVRLLLDRVAETTPGIEWLIPAWDEGVPDDTVYVGSYLWAIYEAADAAAGARTWVDDYAQTLRTAGHRVRVAW
jgi:hypothetical protein